ncbi:MAG: trypsin-like peptidase domain-containing protein [Clostridia bacterium]|nr:trypsin-like peptidase domain-containing protein [Clostridia bacterium]
MKTTNNIRLSDRRRARKNNGVMLLMSLVLVCALAVGGLFALGNVTVNRTASAETGESPAPVPTADDSPAIYVAQKNANSVVGIITNTEGWSRNSGVQNTMIAQGSGVVIAEGGYVLTNYHVIEDGSAFQVLMPSGDKVDATLVGADSAMDLAVLKVEDQADKLVPVTIGASETLPVGSTVIAIGNPGGEILANTVTRGIISALERTSMTANNTTRNVNYIQHDAPISSGNSGGGLFDYQGNLIGINTLKYGGSFYSSGSYEGLGFAIPVETAYPIAQQLIEHGKVIRPQIGVTVKDQEGPDEPMNEYAPASVCITGVNEGSPAQAAGLKQYDFITAVNGERITSTRELTTLLDTFKPGDTVTLTIVRYNNAGVMNNGYDSYYNSPFGFGFGFPFGGYSYGYGNNGNGNNGNGNNGNGSDYYYYNNGTVTVGGGFETFDVQVTLEEKQ